MYSRGGSENTYPWVAFGTHGWVVLDTHSWVCFITLARVTSATHEWVRFESSLGEVRTGRVGEGRKFVKGAGRSLVFCIFVVHISSQ